MLKKKTIVAIYEDDLARLKRVAGRLAVIETAKLKLGSVTLYPADAVEWLLKEHGNCTQMKVAK